MKTITVQIPKELHKRYKKSCKKLGITMRTPIVKAVNATIKEAR